MPRHPECDVSALVAAAYAADRWFGLWVETAMATGASPDQLARLDVADLQDEGDDPCLLIPVSLKGTGKGRPRVERRAISIPPGLATKLREAAVGRPIGAPLLARSDGTRWRDNSVTRVSAVEPALSVDDFCVIEGISRTAYYEMKRRGEGPDETAAGRRRTISPEAHRRWRKRSIVRARAQAAQAEQQPP